MTNTNKNTTIFFILLHPFFISFNIYTLVVQIYNTIVFLFCQAKPYNSIVILLERAVVMLNQRIRETRLARKMSQVDLANALGVTKQSVSNWENDNIQPSIEMLIRLSQVLSTSTDYLLGLENRRYIEVDGLSAIEVAHIQQIIDDIRK